MFLDFIRRPLFLRNWILKCDFSTSSRSGPKMKFDLEDSCPSSCSECVGVPTCVWFRQRVAVCVWHFRPLSATLAAFTPQNNRARQSSSMLTLRPSELTCASTTLMLRIRTVRCGGRVSKEREKEGERERRQKRGDIGLEWVPRRPYWAGVWRVLNYTVWVCAVKLCVTRAEFLSVESKSQNPTSGDLFFMVQTR